MMPKVSIIIPVYNAEGYLQKAIESVQKQTYQNTEIIIVDDSSTDNSYGIARSFESARIKVFKQRNSGAAIARNTGLQAATGDYIQFLDGDDFLSPDKIEMQVEALKNGRSKVAVCNFINFCDDTELNGNIIVPDQSSFIYSTDRPADFLINLWQHSNFIQTNSWLVPKNIIEKAGPWRQYRCPDDDGEFFARVLLAGEGIVYVPGVYNYYRRSLHIDKLSSNKNKKYLQNTLLTIDLKYAYLKKKSDTDFAKKAIARQYLDFAVYNYPQNKILSAIALRRYRALKSKSELPVLGGRPIELIKKTLGWKIARVVRYYLRER